MLEANSDFNSVMFPWLSDEYIYSDRDNEEVGVSFDDEDDNRSPHYEEQGDVIID